MELAEWNRFGHVLREQRFFLLGDWCFFRFRFGCRLLSSPTNEDDDNDDDDDDDDEKDERHYNGYNQ